MKSLFAVALLAALAAGGPGLSFSPYEIADEGAVETAPDAAPSAPDDAMPPADAVPDKTDRLEGQTLNDDNEKKPLDVKRHRPGACPEGPPCKEGN